MLASRDEVDPDLETKFLEAIVDAEINSAGDGDAAMRSIDEALTSAIRRGAGQARESDVAGRLKDDINVDAGVEEGGAEC